MDSAHPEVIGWAARHTEGIDPEDKKALAVALYLAVRDSFMYSPYGVDLNPDSMKASHMLTQESGYCIPKANLLGACARSVGIPARLGFADVKNHVGTEKLEAHLGTDVLTFHGYTDLYLDGKWVKATPAFNKSLCDKLGVAPLEFDGTEDSIFQQYDREDEGYMEYLVDHGTFHEWPREKFIESLQKHYPALFNANPQAPLSRTSGNGD